MIIVKIVTVYLISNIILLMAWSDFSNGVKEEEKKLGEFKG